MKGHGGRGIEWNDSNSCLIGPALEMELLAGRGQGIQRHGGRGIVGRGHLFDHFEWIDSNSCLIGPGLEIELRAGRRQGVAGRGHVVVGCGNV